MLLLIYFIVLVCYIQIKINFLMVGHTHEIIDQVFSRLGVQIKNQNILTLEGMFIHHACCCCGMLQTLKQTKQTLWDVTNLQDFSMKLRTVFSRLSEQSDKVHILILHLKHVHRVHHLVHLPLKCWYIFKTRNGEMPIYFSFSKVKNTCRKCPKLAKIEFQNPTEACTKNIPLLPTS